MQSKFWLASQILLSDNQAIISVVLPIHMLKSFLCATSALALSAGGAVAGGVYLNPEYNHGWSGNDSLGGVLDAHVGYEAGPWYIQGGPQIVFPEGGATDYNFSAKTGLSADVTADGKLGIYTEVSMATGDKSNSYGLKLGSKYKF